MTRHGSFADGTIPLSVEGIQSQIRLAKQQADDEDYPILKAAERGFDRRMLEMCTAERAQGNRLESWQLRAEADALSRMNDATIIDLCRGIRSAGGRLVESYQARFSLALVRLSLVEQGGRG